MNNEQSILVVLTKTSKMFKCKLPVQLGFQAVPTIVMEMTKKMLNDRYSIRNTYPKAKKVYYDEAAGVTVVLWTDGTKTVVRAAEGDKHDAYLGYCTALAKKIHGTNSALKRDLEKVLVVTTKKEKKGNKDEKV